MGDDGGQNWLVWMEWRPAGWLVCLPLLIFPCTIKSRSSILAPAHLGGFGKKGRKTVVVVIIDKNKLHQVVEDLAYSLLSNFQCWPYFRFKHIVVFQAPVSFNFRSAQHGLLIIMAALCNRGALYFCPVLSIFYLLFFPRLISAAAGRMSTILWHMVWP